MTIYTVTLGKGVNTTRQIDFDALPESSRAFIIQYGLTQKLNDAHASIEKGKTDAIEIAVDEMIDRLVDGTVEIRASSTRGDKVQTEAVRLALLVAPGKDAKEKRKNALFMVESNPAKWLTRARENIAYATEPNESLVPNVAQAA